MFGSLLRESNSAIPEQMTLTGQYLILHPIACVRHLSITPGYRLMAPAQHFLIRRCPPSRLAPASVMAPGPLRSVRPSAYPHDPAWGIAATRRTAAPHPLAQTRKEGP